MKMPRKTAIEVFAVCGMNCLVCYRYGRDLKPCEGCQGSEQHKPEHCRTCGIKVCSISKNIAYCYECSEYPCQKSKRLDQSYQKRYHTSLIENSHQARERGIDGFLKQQQEFYTCPQCGGIISIHDQRCSDCQYQLPPRRLHKGICDLQQIPGVGKQMEECLQEIGISCIEDLKGRDPEELYQMDSLRKGYQEDRCVLYVFHGAVYYAEQEEWDPEKLKWWYWKDKEYPEHMEE